jgi:hypothetical protein
MKFRISLVALAVALLLAPVTGRAQSSDDTSSTGAAPPTLRGQAASAALGFHTTAAPLGFRWWVGSRKVGVDVGFGYTSTASLLFDNETLATWTFDGGIPLTVRSWHPVHLLLRPGILYQREQVEKPGATFDTEDVTLVDVSVEFEAEVFLADRFSVSAAHGVSLHTLDRPGSGSISTFSTTGSNVTSIGFHLYFSLDGK